jgi:hypothetical protein
MPDMAEDAPTLPSSLTLFPPPDASATPSELAFRRLLYSVERLLPEAVADAAKAQQQQEEQQQQEQGVSKPPVQMPATVAKLHHVGTWGCTDKPVARTRPMANTARSRRQGCSLFLSVNIRQSLLR